MKKLLSILAALTLLLSVCAFASAEGDTYEIGILQFVQHPALDQATEAFCQALKDKLGDRVVFYEQNASGEVPNCATLAAQLVSKPVDLIMANATPPLQACSNATSDIPILGTSVTDYQTALEIELTAEDATGFNVSGTSDLGPIADQIAFAKKLNPELKTIGILYNSSEANSKFQATMAIDAAKAEGIAYKEFTVTAATELQSVVESMKGQVEVCWLPTDNTCASNMPIISSAAVSAGVMTVCSEAGMVDNGGLCTYGAVDYFTLGQQTGEMAAKIFSGEATVAELEIGFQAAGDDAAVVLNEDVAANFDIPADILEKATLVRTATAE